MKVITKDRLSDIYERVMTNSGMTVEQGLLRDLIRECKELDQLTVTRLRPMSDAPLDQSILAWNGVNFELWYIDSRNPRTLYFEGWIPLPKYEPEQS